jgi:hypothetical protein
MNAVHNANALRNIETTKLLSESATLVASAVARGLMSYPANPTCNPNSMKHTDEVSLEAYELKALGYCYADIAKKCQVPRGSIGRIIDHGIELTRIKLQNTNNHE